MRNLEDASIGPGVRAHSTCSWTQRRRCLGMAFVVGTALLVSACGSSGSDTTSKPPPSATSSTSSPSLVKTASNPKLGTVLADSSGFTLYTLVNGNKPIPCTVPGCSKSWRLLRVPMGLSRITGSPGLTGLGKSRSGTVVTYMGFPLSRYLGDASPGEAKGNNLPSAGGVWYAVKVGSRPGSQAGS
jgi:predicted lipoprotein with Yx(FWY)xxD motif